MTKILWRATLPAILLAACTALPNTAPSRSAGPVTSAGTTRTGSAPIVQKAAGFQIAQCFSAGAPQVGIIYPDGWSRRVSRAETEDELLGGSNTALSQARAYAQPVGGAVSFTYPPAALNPPTEGICEVKFDLSRMGEPSNIVSACSSALFIEAARDAVKAARFKPVEVDGRAARGVNLTYTMKYCLAD